jgi:hypothetical protein
LTVSGGDALCIGLPLVVRDGERAALSTASDISPAESPSLSIGPRQSHCQHLHVDRLVAATHLDALGSGAGMVGGDEGVQIRGEHNFTG